MRRRCSARTGSRPGCSGELDLERDAVVVVAPAVSSAPRLTVLGVHASEYPPGLLVSGTTRQDGYVTLADVTPTIAALAGAEVDEGAIEGRQVEVGSTGGSAEDRRETAGRGRRDRPVPGPHAHAGGGHVHHRGLRARARCRPRPRAPAPVDGPRLRRAGAAERDADDVPGAAASLPRLGTVRLRRVHRGRRPPPRRGVPAAARLVARPDRRRLQRGAAGHRRERRAAGIEPAARRRCSATPRSSPAGSAA